MQFNSNYDSRVVIYEHKMFVRLATELTHDDVTNDKGQEADVWQEEAEDLSDDLAAGAASWDGRRLRFHEVGDGGGHFPEWRAVNSKIRNWPEKESFSFRNCLTDILGKSS